MEHLLENIGDQFKCAEYAGTIKAYRDVLNISVGDIE